MSENSTKPYRLPDPEKQPDSFLVILYKTLRAVEYNDRAWDTLFFARGMKRAQELLAVFQGDVRKAALCMQEVKNDLQSEGLSWTFETIISKSFDWKSRHERRNDRDCLRDLIKAYDNAKMPAKELLRAPETVKPSPVTKTIAKEELMTDEERAEGARVFGEALKKLNPLKVVQS